MNIVDKAIDRLGGQVKLAKKLSDLTGHKYTQAHVTYWKKTGTFPANLSLVVSAEIFNHEITAYEACAGMKRTVANG